MEQLTPTQEALAAHDKLHDLGFRRDEDWFISHEGRAWEERIHIDTIAALVSQPAVGAQPLPAQPTLPTGWVPLLIEWEPGYPEEVAYGPQIMMDRLKKWLDKFYAYVIAEKAATPSGWIVEHGAVSLPIGHPSRITVKNFYESPTDAAKAYEEAKRDFDSIFYPVFEVTTLQAAELTDEAIEWAWRDGWRACRDAETVGFDSENTEWGFAAANVIERTLRINALPPQIATPPAPSEPAQPVPAGDETITVQEAWELAGGNPGIRATRQELSDALRQLDAVCDEAATHPQLAQQESNLDSHIHHVDSVVGSSLVTGCGGLDGSVELSGVTQAGELVATIYERNGDASIEWHTKPRELPIGTNLYASPVTPGEPAGAQAADNGGKTGWPPGMLQDDCRGLSKWLSAKPNAKQEAREASDAIAPQAVGERLPLTDADFETWWQQEGQFGRAGGGEYEKTFAFNAWNAAIKALKEPT